MVSAKIGSFGARLGKKEITTILGLQGTHHDNEYMHIAVSGMGNPDRKAWVS